VQPDERHLFTEQQEQRFAVDSWEDLLSPTSKAAAIRWTMGVLRRVTVTDLLGKALKLDKSRWDKQAQLRVVGVLRRHGWIRKRESTGTRQWYYARPETQ
jgi:putative DNA primase/helicase